MRDGGRQAFTAADLLSALLLSVAARAPHDDIALLEHTQSLARAIGWHPIWDVLLAALAQEISAGRIQPDTTGGLRPAPTGKKHLATLLAGPSDQAPAAMQMPFIKLKRRVNGNRVSATRVQAVTRAESA
jgi:hypothetical protein